MRCPFCKTTDDRVIDTRPTSDHSVIRRRRECLQCGRRYTTHERIEDTELRVVKKDGRRVPFDRSKILAGILKALEKRPVSLQQANELVDSITARLNERTEREIKTSEIGEMVMESLRDLDEVAYVRFASVYREFKAVDEFVQEVRTIRRRGGRYGED